MITFGEAVSCKADCGLTPIGNLRLLDFTELPGELVKTHISEPHPQGF